MTVVVIMAVQLLPEFLDLVMPLNQSRSRDVIYIEYFEETDMFYLALFYLIIVFTFGAIMILATETTYVLFIYHLFGLFGIVG